MKSLLSIEFENEEKYWQIIQHIEPEYYLLRFALKQYNINPMLMPRIIRAIANLATGDGYGKIVVYMQKREITAVETIEHDRIEEPSLLDNAK